MKLWALIKLAQRWRIEAATHQGAADEIAGAHELTRDEEEEMTLHLETARVYRKCAKELERVKEITVGVPGQTD